MTRLPSLSPFDNSANLTHNLPPMVTVHRWEWIALAAVLLLAALLRFGWVGVNSFSFDEARVSQMALRMAREGDLAELGMQSSTGVPNFPAAVWLFALPYAVSRDPQVATWFASALSWLAVGGMWWLGRLWHRGAGLAAALLIATSPYILFYSRSIWSQNLLAPLAILWAVAAVCGLSGRARAGWLLLHAFLAGLAVQIHFAGACLAFASLWLGLRYRLWQRWRPVTGGILLALLCAMPTLYTLWRDGAGAQADLRQLLSQPAQITGRSFTQLGQLGLGWGWEQLWLNAQWVWPAPLEQLLNVGILISALLLVGGAVVRQRELSPPQQVLRTLLPAWLLCAPLLFLRSAAPVHLQYQLPALPACFLLMAAALPSSGRWSRLGVALVVGLALVQSVAVAQTLSLVGRELIPGGLGTPLRYPQAAVQTLRADWGPRPIAVHAIGDVVEFDGDAAVFGVLLWDTPHRLAEGRSVLLLPDDPAILLATFDNVPAWQMAREVGLLESGRVQPLPRRQGEPPYMALITEGSPPDLVGFTPLSDDWSLANGAQLQGWRLDALPDGRWRLFTHWHIAAVLAPDHYQQFNHLYTAEGDQPAQVRDVTLSSRTWVAGDHLISWVEFEPPAAPIDRFEVGMYTWPALQRSPLRGRAGDAIPLR